MGDKKKIVGEEYFDIRPKTALEFYFYDVAVSFMRNGLHKFLLLKAISFGVVMLYLGATWYKTLAIVHAFAAVLYFVNVMRVRVSLPSLWQDRVYILNFEKGDDMLFRAFVTMLPPGCHFYEFSHFYEFILEKSIWPYYIYKEPQ